MRNLYGEEVWKFQRQTAAYARSARINPSVDNKLRYFDAEIDFRQAKMAAHIRSIEMLEAEIESFEAQIAQLGETSDGR